MEGLLSKNYIDTRHERDKAILKPLAQQFETFSVLFLTIKA